MTLKPAKTARVDQRRNAIQSKIKNLSETESRVRRVYFDSSSFALLEKHEAEFAIKCEIANRYSIPFRSVVFAGSAQLGFSPHNDTEFVPGTSDLDVACIDSQLFQKYWGCILKATSSFNDETKFIKIEHSENMKTHLLKRGMILFDFLPLCAERTEEITFLENLSRNYRAYFSRISLAVYINENAFCWKQASALEGIIGNNNAK